MEDLPEESFWMVWNPEGHSPTFRHREETSAVTEADRLARANPGQMFIVLMAVRAVRKTDTEHRILGAPIPF